MSDACKHEEVRWLHRKYVQDCDYCSSVDGACTLAICSECGVARADDELTDKQQRFLADTA